MPWRGTHKSAVESENESTLLSNYDKEVKHGWMLSITVECVSKLKGASVIPVGVAKQFIIDCKRKQKKRRTTHDASFAPRQKNQSIAQWIKSYLPTAPMVTAFFGFFT